MLERGEVFAGFTVERLLGMGGMGSVYLARQPRMDRLIALKLLNRELFTHAEVRARFEREADLVAQLDHPSIVTVYDRGSEDGQLWISMQYVDGVDAGTVDVTELPPERAVQIIEGVAAALDYAHSMGVLHRDVKPANIMLARSSGGQGERVFLTDFGIARLREDSTHLTQDGMFTATLAYASPEQMTGNPLDHRTDQYSLACALYWLLVGVGPFDSPNPADIIHGHLQLAPAPIAGRRPGIPPAVDAVLAKGMAKHPGQRYGSCGEFAAAARAALTAPAGAPAFAPAAQPPFAGPVPAAQPPAGPGHAPQPAPGAQPQQSPQLAPGQQGQGPQPIPGGQPVQGPQAASGGQPGKGNTPAGGAHQGQVVPGGQPGQNPQAAPGGQPGQGPQLGQGARSGQGAPGGQPGQGPLGGQQAGRGQGPAPGEQGQASAAPANPGLTYPPPSGARGPGPAGGTVRPWRRTRAGTILLGWLIVLVVVLLILAGIAFVVLGGEEEGDTAGRAVAPTPTSQPATSAGEADPLAASRRAFPVLVPSGRDERGLGYQDADCFLTTPDEDRVRFDELALSVGTWTRAWRCDRDVAAITHMNYVVLQFPNAAAARAAVDSLPAHNRTEDRKDGAPVVLHRWIRPDAAGPFAESAYTARLVVSFGADPQRAAFLLSVAYHSGAGGTDEPQPSAQAAIDDWWERAPL